MPDLENATIQLYEDESLADTLRDPAATDLLRWGAGRLQTIAERYPKETEFAETFKKLRQIMKRVNRLVGERQHSPPEDQAEILSNIAEGAYELGWTPPVQGIEALVRALRSMPEPAALQAVLDWIDPSVPVQAQAEDQNATDDDDSPVSTRLVPRVNTNESASPSDTLPESRDHSNDEEGFWGHTSQKDHSSDDESY
jgi:hypothetical protein